MKLGFKTVIGMILRAPAVEFLRMYEYASESNLGEFFADVNLEYFPDRLWPRARELSRNGIIVGLIFRSRGGYFEKEELPSSQQEDSSQQPRPSPQEDSREPRPSPQEDSREHVLRDSSYSPLRRLARISKKTIQKDVSKRIRDNGILPKHVYSKFKKHMFEREARIRASKVFAGFMRGGSSEVESRFYFVSSYMEHVLERLQNKRFLNKRVTCVSQLEEPAVIRLMFQKAIQHKFLNC